MTTKLLSFLTGAIVASAWWQAAIFDYGKSSNGEPLHAQFLVAFWITAAFVGIFIFNCMIHLDDK